MHTALGNANRLHFAQYLIGKGANPLARGTQGTAADVANQVHETAIAAYLQGAYAQPWPCREIGPHLLT
jgi:hypothetical protein